MISQTFFSKLGVVVMLLILFGTAVAQTPPSKALDHIRKHQVLRVGVKTDFSPYNSIDAKGEIVGFESDIAEQIASKLGVTLKKVGVTTENRFQKLELGDVDLLIATVGDTAARRQIASAVEPGYGETSVNVVFPADRAVNNWENIRNKTICAVQGSYFNKPMSERYLLNLQYYKTVRDAHLALRDGQCSGLLYATPALANTLKLPQWANYTMPLPPALITPLAIFIARQESGAEFDTTLGDLLADLHRSGWLIETSRKWGMLPSTWLMQQAALWAAKDDAGHYQCRRNESGKWPAACRSPEYVSSQEAGGLQAIGLWVKEHVGVDLNMLYDPYDRNQFLRGILYTMLLIAGSVGVSLVLGVAAAIAVDTRPSWWTRGITAVMAYGRLTPPILMMYLLFFGVGGWCTVQFGIKIPAFAVATFCSGYYTGGLVMNALLEAARHLRTRQPAFTLALRKLRLTAEYANWPIKQALINLTKQSMIASAIAIPELLSASSMLIAEKGNIFFTMTVLVVTFYAITSVWTRLFNYAERQLLIGTAGNDN